jgi:HK97 family phage portal protein
MAWWNRSKQPKQVESRDYSLQDLLLGVPVDGSTITKEQAMEIPAVAMAVNLISDTVASLPVKLYKNTGDKISCVDDDPRVSLLNLDTKDTLDGFQYKKALIEDFLMYGAGYTYINRARNKVVSLHYVSNRSVSVRVDPNPIFKKNTILVWGGEYKDWEFIKLTRKTRNGATGVGIVQENNQPLSVAYNVMLFESMLYRTGGNKKGFLKAQNRLSPDAMRELKSAFNNLYANNTENVVVLNNGLEFQEANNSSVEMQVNQNKVTNASEIAKMFSVPVELLNGKATGGNEMLYDSFIKMSILPILKAFETALNKDLLLDNEKGSFYFAFDTTDLLKGDIEKRFKAYEVAVKNGIFQVDEVRHMENFSPLGLDFIKLGLQDVLYNPLTKEIYTPNTNKQVVMGEEIDDQQPDPNKPPDDSLKGGDNTNESGDKGK